MREADMSLKQWWKWRGNRTDADAGVDAQRARRIRIALRSLIQANAEFAHSPVCETLATTNGLLVTLANGEKFMISVENRSRDR